jgi:hypothetical protein
MEPMRPKLHFTCSSDPTVMAFDRPLCLSTCEDCGGHRGDDDAGDYLPNIDAPIQWLYLSPDKLGADGCVDLISQGPQSAWSRGKDFSIDVSRDVRVEQTPARLVPSFNRASWASAWETEGRE